jgi:hypothetical protein
MKEDRTLHLDVFQSFLWAKNIRAVSSRSGKLAVVFLLTLLVSISLPLAHSPNVDADLSDWCLGAPSNTAGGRVEDSFANLVCGNCSTTTNQACELTADCPGGETCVNVGSKEELVWWDNRTDGAVNDLGTVAMTQDNEFLYISAELWVDPDPLSLPFGEIAIDFQNGGLTVWHDPNAVLENSGTCSVSTDRACTSDADCHFCTISTEPFPSTRPRACGSTPVDCNNLIPGDDCITTEVCQNIGASGKKPNVGVNAAPGAIGADYLFVFDFSRWLISADGSSLLMVPGAAAAPWDPKFGCVPDFAGDLTICDFDPAVNPGASGGSGGPPGGIEMAVPWSAFGCTGCPGNCSCPDFGPGQDFRFTMIIARGSATLDYTPDGAIEDVLSEAVAGTYTTSSNSCPGFGIGNTDCEIADGSMDAYIPPTTAAVPGGECRGLQMTKNQAPSVTLNWDPSCSSADNDYGVYEGLIGTWYSHFEVPAFCSTGGATNATFNTSAGNHYYLIVPSDGSTEGSYGLDSTPIERPASTTPCLPQSLGTCP